MNYVRIKQTDFPEHAICKIYVMKNIKTDKEDLYLQDINGNSYLLASGLYCDVVTYRDALYSLLGWSQKEVPDMPIVQYEYKTIKDTEEFSAVMENPAGYTEPEYVSTDHFIAGVEADGSVTGMGFGYCDIKIYYKKPVRALAKVIHLIVLPEQPQIVKSSHQIVIGNTDTIELRKIDGFSNPQWASSNTDIATISNSGVCKTRNEGTCLLSAYYSSPYKAKVAEVTLSVVPIAPSVKTETHTIKQGLLLQGHMPENTKFSGAEWSVKSGEGIVTVNQNGAIEGKKVGNAVVVGKYTKPYKTDAIIYNITVEQTPEEADIESITVNPEQIKVNTDAVVAVAFSKTPLGTATLEGDEFTTVQDALDVHENVGHANITGAKVGTSTLTVKLGAKSLTKQVKVIE